MREASGTRKARQGSKQWVVPSVAIGRGRARATAPFQDIRAHRNPVLFAIGL